MLQMKTWDMIMPFVRRMFLVPRTITFPFWEYLRFYSMITSQSKGPCSHFGSRNMAAKVIGHAWFTLAFGFLLS